MIYASAREHYCKKNAEKLCFFYFLAVYAFNIQLFFVILQPIMKIEENNIQSVYFLGIGGIGMSALARYFHSRGYRVGGYDRTPSALTRQLEKEGMEIIYEDDTRLIPEWAMQSAYCLIVRTPAVPADTAVYQWFTANDFDIRKRAEVLGLVTRQKHALCVAGTHGKTTTSTLLAHLMYQSEHGANAFLGGISVNYNTNLLLDKQSDFVVVEADEYDRSFHHLTPYISIITSVDADHLDIYGTAEAYRESFEHYSSLITSAFVVKYGADMTPRPGKNVKGYTYCGSLKDCAAYAEGQEKPDFYAQNIRVQNGDILFDFVTPTETIADIKLGVPVWVNIENSVAAMSVAWLCGLSADELRMGVASFRGVQRRFNIHVKTDHVVYVDDYAHHPTELAASIESIRRVYPERHLIGVFQPHLYTRTRDFADDFRRVLHQVDELILLPIYPARELPIEGVTAEILLNGVNGDASPNGGYSEMVIEKSELVAHLKKRVAEIEKPVVIMTLGAGDIDRLVEEIGFELKMEN